MKAKYISISHVVLLLVAVIAGLLLKNNLADGPRMSHRLVGLLASIVGLTLAIVLLKHGTSVAQRACAWGSVVFSFVAGFAGMQLKSTDDYDRMFNLMRGSGILALLLAAAVLVMTYKAVTVKSPEPKEKELVDGN